MEPCNFVHNIKAEKATALARYRLLTNISKPLRLMEAFVAVTLISWSSTHLPSVFKLSGEYLVAFMSYLMNQHVVFLVGNVIVFLCYVLSRYTDSCYDSGGPGIHYDQWQSLKENPRRAESHGSHKFISHGGQDSVHVKLSKKNHENLHDSTKKRENIHYSSTESGNLIIPNDKAITEMVTEPEVAAVTAIKQAAKQIERFRRTQSELKSKISVKQEPELPELRRSVTERRKSMAVNSFPAVDKLSNEDFRIAVETFILKQQRFLKQQSMAIDGS